MNRRQSTFDRENKVIKILDDAFNKQPSATAPSIQPYSNSLDALFSSTIWGYREILLVIFVAMKLDPTYRASVDFYKCKPRAIYEGPIKSFLLLKNLPHRKSGPLNIAKATEKLDGSWSSKRSEPDLANEVLKILAYLENTNRTPLDLDTFGTELLKRYKQVQMDLEELEIDYSPESDPHFLYDISRKLIEETPDAGNTPQRICGLLLKNFHSSINSNIEVTGYNDRASVTSTTSKKPGDINEESLSGSIYKVYEVTVKKFDQLRMQDSVDCISIYNTANKTEINEVIVLCRPVDCPAEMDVIGTNLCLGRSILNSITYYFWDIFEWIAMTLQHTTSDGRVTFYSELNEYISEVSTAKKVKELWKDIHEN